MQQPRVGLRDDEAELRFWDHYRTVTAPALSGSFDADFWSRFLVRVSHEEPSVRHAIIALSFLHQKFEGSKGCITNTRRAPLTDPANGFALRQYNKAIGSLRNRMHGEPEQAQKATILTCIVFIIIEFIQGKVKEAMVHFKQGLKVLCASEMQDSFISLLISANSLLKSEVLRENVLPTFTRLSILPLLSGESPPGIRTIVIADAAFLSKLEIPSQFRSLKEARSLLVSIIGLGLRFVRSADAYKFEPHWLNSHTYDTLLKDYPSEPLLIHQRNLLAALEGWATAFSMYTDPDGTRSASASQLLQIYHLVTTIWTSSALSCPESAFDSHVQSFSSILRLTKTMLASHPNTRRVNFINRYSPLFGFEMGMIPPLYFTATKCRYIHTRVAALSLLRSAPARQENAFSATVLAKVAQRVIEIEHGEVGSRSLLTITPQHVAVDGGVLLNPAILPAESKRVHDADVDPRDLRVVDGVYRKRVTFFGKPAGIDGPWQSLEEWIAIY